MHVGHEKEGTWQSSSDNWDPAIMTDCTEHLRNIMFLLVNAKIILPARATKIINRESLLGRAFARINMQQLLESPWINVLASKDKQHACVNKTDPAPGKEQIKLPNGLYFDLDKMYLDLLGIDRCLGI